MSQNEPADLPALSLAHDLSQEDRRQLGSHGDFTAAEDGQTVIMEGLPQDSLSRSGSGMVHVQSEAGGRRVLLSTLRARDMIGEVNIFDVAEASATVVANGFAVMRSIECAKVDAFMFHHPEVSGKLLGSIATTLRRTREKAALQQQLANP